MLVLVHKRAECEQLARGAGGVPTAYVRRGPLAGRLSDARVGHTQLLFEDKRVVGARLDVHQQAVERSHVDARCIEPALERLDERRPGAGERVEDMLARTKVAREQRFDELRNELAQVRMQPVDVLRPLTLGKVTLGPGEREIDVSVEGVLGQGHPRLFDAVIRKPRAPAPIVRRGRRKPLPRSRNTLCRPRASRRTSGDIRLLESSSHSVLDDAALDTIRSLPRMPLPPDLPARPLRVRVPVVFQLQ